MTAVSRLEPAVLSGGAAIVQGIEASGVNVVFGLPGVQLYALFDALALRASAIRTIVTRHEQGAAYMAYGYARSTGRPGVFCVVPGPGVLNAAAALATALGGNEPVVCLTGQIPSGFIGQGRGHVHELPDQLGTLALLTKWAARIDRPADAPHLVEQAIGTALSGRPGPVALEMPWDVMLQQEPVAPSIVPSAAARQTPPAVDADAVEAAARRLVAARAPMIMVGRGAMDAGPEILALAEALDAPVSAFRSGRGIVGDDHELGLTCAGAYQAWPETDLLLGIGTRLELPYMKWGSLMQPVPRPATPQLIRIDIDPAEMKRIPAEVGIVADAGEAATALLAAVLRLPGRRRDRARIADVRGRAEQATRVVQPQLQYLQAMRDVMPRDAILVEELSQVGLASYYGFPVYQPRTFISAGYQANLGFGFQAGLGAKVAHPDKVVVSIAGDGGFMFGVQELATAAQYGIGLVTVLFNNNSFGNVRRDQQRLYDNRVIGSDLRNPDFIKLAESFGVRAMAVTDPAGLRAALTIAIEDGGPWLIEVKVERGSESSPWVGIHGHP